MLVKISRESALELIKRVLFLWPDEIKVDNKTHFSNGGARIPVLSDIHEKISDEFEVSAQDQNDLAESVNWSIFSIAHQLARMSNVIRPSEIDKNYLIEYLRDKSNWDIVE